MVGPTGETFPVPLPLKRRLPPRVLLAVLVALVGVVPAARANGPLPTFYFNTCPSMIVRFVQQGEGVRLKTTEDATCSLVGSESTSPITMLTSFETRLLSVGEVAWICSVLDGPTPVTGPHPFATVGMLPLSDDGPGTARNPGGPVNFRYSGTHLLAEFHWTPSDGSEIEGLGVFAGSSCGVGSSFTGRLDLYDPNLTPTVEFIQDLLGPVLPRDGGSGG